MCALNHQQISSAGVRDKEGEYVISLPTYSRTVVFAGTAIVYTREQTQYNDKVKIEGPTTAVIQIVVSTPAMPPLQRSEFRTVQTNDGLSTEKISTKDIESQLLGDISYEFLRDTSLWKRPSCHHWPDQL